MNSVRFFLFFCMFFVIGRAFPVFAEDSTCLRIVYVNNLPDIEKSEHIGGLSELSGLLKKNRTTHEHVLFLHGGGFLAPSAMSSFDRGAHMVDLLNTLHPDAVAAAKEEFAHKEDELTLRSFEASFPILSANTFDPATGGSIEGIEKRQLYDVGAYKVGVFALTDLDVVVDYLVNRITLKDTREVIRENASALRKNGADLVVLLVDFPVPGLRELLSGGMVDIVFDYERDDFVRPTKKGVWIELGSGKGRAALLDVAMRGAQEEFVWSHEEEIISLKDVPRDPNFQNLVDSYLKYLSKLMDLVVGKTATALDTHRKSVRQAENAFGNLVADILRDFCASDVALMNGGGIRGQRTYAAGTELTQRDIHNELPFRNHVVCLRITGKGLTAALENGVSRIEDNKGRFLHVSGLHMKYAPQAPAGQRVRSVTVGSKALDPAQHYVMGTVDYLASGGDAFVMLRKGERIGNIGGSPLLWELVRSYIAECGVVSPTVEGRVVQVNE